MGATLPLIVQIFASFSPDFSRNLSGLYFVNTIGAAVGAFLCAFIAISLFGLDGAVRIAAGVNFLIAGASFFIAKKHEPAAARPDHAADNESSGLKWKSLAPIACLAFGAGFLTIAYEIVFVRIIGFVIKSSPYAFASILTVFLFGLGFGSFLIWRFLHRVRSPFRWIAFCLAGSSIYFTGMTLILKLGPDGWPFGKLLRAFFRLPDTSGCARAVRGRFYRNA